jgi:hypothetical protein
MEITNFTFGLPRGGTRQARSKKVHFCQVRDLISASLYGLEPEPSHGQ